MLDSLQQKGKDKGKLWLEIMAENMIALYNFNRLHRYEQGFEHHQRVYNLIKNLDPKDFPYKQNCLFQIADEHYFFRDFQKAIFYNKEALHATPSKKLDDRPVEIYLMNTLGLCYQQLGQLDSAAFYFKRTIKLAQNTGQEAWDGIASGNLGHNLFMEKKYKEAIPLLEKDIRIAVKTQDWGLASGSQMVLANISLLQGDRAQTEQYLKLARMYVNRSGQYQRRQYLYPLLSKWYAWSGQSEKSAMYLDSTIFVKDSLNRQLSALFQLRAMQKVDQERHRSEIDGLKAERRFNLLERNILLVAVLFLISGTIVVYRQQQKKALVQKEQAIRAKKELEEAESQLNIFEKNISEKNSLIELLEQQSGETNQDALSQLQQSTILTDADWAYFKGLFEKVHGGYLQRLREKMPDLTPAEIRFMALCKLNLSTREMAAMLGIGTDTIRQHRSRLRKKLNLTEEVNLEELARHI